MGFRSAMRLAGSRQALPDEGPTLPSAIQVVMPFNLPPDHCAGRTGPKDTADKLI